MKQNHQTQNFYQQQQKQPQMYVYPNENQKTQQGNQNYQTNYNPTNSFMYGIQNQQQLQQQQQQNLYGSNNHVNFFGYGQTSPFGTNQTPNSFSPHGTMGSFDKPQLSICYDSPQQPTYQDRNNTTPNTFTNSMKTNVNNGGSFEQPNMYQNTNYIQQQKDSFQNQPSSYGFPTQQVSNFYQQTSENSLNPGQFGMYSQQKVQNEFAQESPNAPVLSIESSDVNFPSGICCTGQITGSQLFAQFYNVCLDCSNQSVSVACCSACAIVCHKGHQLASCKYGEIVCGCRICSNSSKKN